MSTAVATSVELLTFEAESKRALDLFAALEAAARRLGLDITRTATYRGASPWLLLWGPGAPARAKVMARHVAAGGRALVFDLAYWDRLRKVRVSFDAAHPSAHVMTVNEPLDRLASDRVPFSNDWNPNGPIVIAGLGDKARVQYGAAMIDGWETARMRECQAQWPDRPIQYRKKKPLSPMPGWATEASSLPIEQVLKGTSLVITYHSNVAVDAIRMGIPVVCQDGAAAAVCSSSLPVTPAPLPESVRERFLGNLAWFQWNPAEAEHFWRWAQGRLG